ncbi:hypothetical protein [Rhizobium laguerreae]|uniref:hypothetical protein n=1 Tax=Rhizobium laguerreae TaxID=1076926 RepID=UPI001C90D514|nr:hypothetical protein [Rhizobium laguerreae]MBY3363744.1 hypothetical protein [Rhizobium laguerreae]
MIYLAKLDAWDQPFDPAIHCRNDFRVLSGSLVEREEEEVITAYMKIRVKNPGAAWISTQPQTYYVLSERRRDDPVAVQLARGRIVPLPSELAGKAMDVDLICVPPDEDEVFKAAANLLRVGEVNYDPDDAPEAREAAERYDPLFYPPEAEDDPTNVLAATTELWRWDRVTLALERVDMITGRTVFTVTAGLVGSERLSLDNPPKAKTKLRMIAQWTQSASGDQNNPFMTNQEVTSYNYKSILDGMPSAGTAIGNANGWTIADAYFDDIEPLLPQTFGHQFPSIWGATSQRVTLQAMAMNVTMKAHYEYSQPREEIMDIVMLASVQDVLGDDREEIVEQINLADITLDVTTSDWLYEDPDTLEVKTYAVGDKVQANGKCWICVTAHEATEEFTAQLYDEDLNVIATLWQKTPKQAAVDARVAGFFDRPRGKRSVRHGIRRVNRKVQRRARAATIQVEAAWLVGRSMTCADAARIENKNLPGGEVLGKITVVELRIDGARRSTILTLATSIGTGVAPADPDAGQEQTADIVYSVRAPATNEPVDAFGLAIKAPRFIAIENDANVQNGYAFTAASFGEDPVKAIQENPTKIRVYYDPLRQEDLITRRMSATTMPIHVTKGLDLHPELP